MNKFEKLAHRRAGKNLRITDALGNPLKNTKLQLKQVKHAFLFGCGAFDINSFFETEDAEKKAMYQERMELWFDLFNYGTLPFYWGGYHNDAVMGFEAYPDSGERFNSRYHWARIEVDGTELFRGTAYLDGMED